MAFYKNHKYFKTVKIWLTDEPENGAERPENDTYVILREPTTEEAFTLRVEEEEKAIDAFRALIPAILIDHNFYEDETETKKLTGEEVADVLFGSYSAFFEVLTKYTSAVFRPAK